MLNKDIINLYQGIQSLKNRDDLRVPARVSFTLVRGARSLLPLVEDYNDARKIVLEQLGTLNDDGSYNIPNESLDKLNQEFNDIDNIDVPVDLQHIKFEDIENLDLSIQEAEALELILEGES